MEDGLGDTIRVSLTEEPEYEIPVAKALVKRYDTRIKHDPIEEIKELLHDGAQVLVDTVGSIQAISQYMPAMNRFGHIVSAGFYGTEDLLALQPPRYKELSIDLVSGWTPERMDRTLTLIADGTLETLSLITHHFPVTKAADAWRLIEEKTEPVLGVILDW